MTPQETEAFQARQAARSAVLAKMADPAAPPLDDADILLMSPSETLRAINAGRVPGIGRDRRLRRSA